MPWSVIRVPEGQKEEEGLWTSGTLSAGAEGGRELGGFLTTLIFSCQ